MSHDESDHRVKGEAGVEDSVFSRWASGGAERGRSVQTEGAPVYMILTCQSTFDRTLFYIPAPPAPPPRRRKTV